MSTTNNTLIMQRAIIKYIESRIPKDKNKAHIGRIVDGNVVISNSTYSYTPVVDMYFGEGSAVACLLPEHSAQAIVVGVMP